MEKLTGQDPENNSNNIKYSKLFELQDSFRFFFDISLHYWVSSTGILWILYRHQKVQQRNSVNNNNI